MQSLDRKWWLSWNNKPQHISMLRQDEFKSVWMGWGNDKCCIMIFKSTSGQLWTLFQTAVAHLEAIVQLSRTPIFTV